MNYLDVLIFVIVLFIYLHIYYHFNTSNDMEIYTMDELIKEKLEEICNIKQPLKFKYNDQQLNKCTLKVLTANTNPEFELNIRDISTNLEDTQYILPFKINDALNVINNDNKSRYITEKNIEFLENVNVLSAYENTCDFLKPPMTVSTKYDLYSGSKDSNTPLRYNIHYRNFYYVSSGKIMLKLIPPKDTHFLNQNKDYDLFEFNSNINPWNVSSQYIDKFKNVNHMDIELVKGDMIYIPAYWWYSIKYIEISSICVFQYKTVMNVMTITPEIIMYFLQTQNTKHKTESTIENILINVGKEKKEKKDN